MDPFVALFRLGKHVGDGNFGRDPVLEQVGIQSMDKVDLVMEARASKE